MDRLDREDGPLFFLELAPSPKALEISDPSGPYILPNVSAAFRPSAVNTGDDSPGIDFFSGHFSDPGIPLPCKPPTARANM